MQEELDALAECRDCGLLQRLPTIPGGGWAACWRCSARLAQSRPRSVPLCMASAVAGLMLITLGVLAPLATVSTESGRFASANVMAGPQALTRAGAVELSVVVVLTLLLLPALRLLVILAMGVGAHRGTAPLWLRKAFARVRWLSAWSMVDVFMLGAAVALTRLRGWMHVDLGPALLALGGVSACSLLTDHQLDERAFWRRIRPQAPSITTAASTALVGCDACQLVQRRVSARCERCGHGLRRRKPNVNVRTWALIGAALLLAIPANALPVMTVSNAGMGEPSTILGGTLELLSHGFWGLSAIVFVASIVVPMAKVLSLAVLLLSTARRSSRQLVLRTRVFRWVALLGRWSMLDIFATMTLAALARFGWLGSVVPEVGASAFCAVVLLTMWAVETFDPRLMWDAAGQNDPLVVEHESAR